MPSTKATRLASRPERLPGLYLDGWRLLARPGAYASNFTLAGQQVFTQVLPGNYTISGLYEGNGGLLVNVLGVLTVQRTPSYVWGADTDAGALWARLGNGGDGIIGNSPIAQNGTLGAGGGGAGDTPGGSNNARGGYGGNGFVVLVFTDAAGTVLPKTYDLVVGYNGAYPVPNGAQRVYLYAGGAGGPGGSGLGTTGTNAAGGGGGGGLVYAYAALNGATVLNLVTGIGGTPTRGGGGTAGTATVVTFSDVVMTAGGGASGGQGWGTGGGGAGGAATVTGTTLAKATYAGQAGATGSWAGGGGGACGRTGAATGTTGAIALDRNGLAAVLAHVGGNLYSGGTQVLAGTLLAQHRYAFGSGPITVWPGATLNKNGFAVPNTITNNGGIVV